MNRTKNLTHRRRRRNKTRSDGRRKPNGTESKQKDSSTNIDHAPMTAFLTAWAPMLCKLLGLPKESILSFFGDQSNRYNDQHRVSHEGHVDTIDEHQEREEDHKVEKGKLKVQEPEKLIDEDRIQPIYLVGLIISSVLLVLSFAATVIATSTQIQEHSSNGSWYYALSIGLIAAFGSSLLKWSVHYPFAEFKTEVEMLLVPVAFFFFGLFVYQLTELYFYSEPAIVEQADAPDFSEFLLGESTAPTTEPSADQEQKDSSKVISLKWFYIGVLGTEMFASYAFLSFISTCATLQPKAIVRAIKALQEKTRSPRHRNRVKIRKSRKQVAWLRYQEAMSQAPGKALQELFKRLFN